MRTIKKIPFPFSRNYIFTAIAMLVTLYGLFMVSTPSQHVYSIGLLVVLIPFLEIRNQERVIQLFSVFFVCVLISSIALFDRLPHQLLISSQPFWTALKKGIPIAFVICVLAHLFFWKKIGLIKLYGIQFPIMIIACIWYMRMLLILGNCQHTPEAKNVQITAIVVQKCPVCCDIHELLLSFAYEGRQYQMPIDVHPKLYEKAKEGDKLNLHLHPGVYGWPWYHKDIKRRYR